MNQIDKAQYKLLKKLANIEETTFDDLGRIAYALLKDDDLG